MRTSTQFPLAVHVLLMLAAFPDKKVTSEAAAVSAGVNPVVVRGLFGKLTKAGIIETKSGRGRNALAKAPGDVTLWDVYEAVEGGDASEPFKMHGNTSDTCPVGTNIHELLGPHLEDAAAAMRRELSAVTLEDLKGELAAKLKP